MIIWDEFIKRLITEVHWPMFVNFGILLLFLWLIVKHVDKPLSTIFRGLAREALGLAKLKVDRGTINFAGVVILGAVFAGYLFVGSVRDLLELQRISAGEDRSDMEMILVLAGLLIIGATAILSVAFTGADDHQ